MRDRRSIITALGFIAAVAALAMAGSVLAVGVLGGRPEQRTADRFPAPAGARLPASFAVADDVPTSFGAMSVKHAERLDGVTARELAGMTHGVNGLVGKKQLRLQVTVTLTNLLDRPLAYAPDSFTLRTEKDGKPMRITGASLKPGVLQPDASIDARIDFTAPRAAKRFWIDFDDPGRARPTTVALGAVEELPNAHGAGSGDAQDLLQAAAGKRTSDDHHGLAE